MDRLTKYKALIKAYFIRYAELLNAPPASNLTVSLALDDEHGQYLLVQSGWEDKRYVRYTPLHVYLRNDKIWIEEDLTEEGIVAYLIQQGVPQQAIVLGFHAPSMRPLAEFAVA